MRGLPPLAPVAALALAGCASANVQITSPVPDVRVSTRVQACDTPCTLRLPVGRMTRIVARDPRGLIDFTYEIVPQDGLNELEVLAPGR